MIKDANIRKYDTKDWSNAIRLRKTEAYQWKPWALCC